MSGFKPSAQKKNSQRSLLAENKRLSVQCFDSAKEIEALKERIKELEFELKHVPLTDEKWDGVSQKEMDAEEIEISLQASENNLGDSE